MRYPNFTGTEPCAQVGFEPFFEDPLPNGILEHRNLLIDTCNHCPMLVECRTWALHHEEYGWWAGTTRRERISLRKELGIKFQPLMRAS
jgi:hypothetical protein